MDFEYFRGKPGRIRGLTVEERLQFIADRWQKVANDCNQAREEGRDMTAYRINYGSQHADCLQFMNDHGPEKLLERMNQKYYSSLLPGQRDAIGYVVAELEKALAIS